MNTTPDSTNAKNYERIAQAIRFLLSRATPSNETVSLAELAAHLSLSEHHCQKLFHQWAGITPKQFQQFLRKDYALAQLEKFSSILDATYNSGLSSPSRLHDLILHWEAVTPGQARSKGRDLTIEYGIGHTRYGNALLAKTSKGICHLVFCADLPESIAEEINKLFLRWPLATYIRNDKDIQHDLTDIFNRNQQTKPQPLHLWGTPFQHKVWEALLYLDAGQVCTYSHIAHQIQQPTAARAVGTAVGSNSIAVLIPCHRVIQQTGLFSGYRWGVERKISLLIDEWREEPPQK